MKTKKLHIHLTLNKEELKVNVNLIKRNTLLFILLEKKISISFRTFYGNPFSSLSMVIVYNIRGRYDVKKNKNMIFCLWVIQCFT